MKRTVAKRWGNVSLLDKTLLFLRRNSHRHLHMVLLLWHLSLVSISAQDTSLASSGSGGALRGDQVSPSAQQIETNNYSESDEDQLRALGSVDSCDDDPCRQDRSSENQCTETGNPAWPYTCECTSSNDGAIVGFKKYISEGVSHFQNTLYCVFQTLNQRV